MILAEKDRRIRNRCFERECEEKACPLAKHTFHTHFSAMQFNKLAADEEAQPGAGVTAPVLLPHLAKFLEDFEKVLGRDAHAGIDYAEEDVHILFLRREGDAPLIGETQPIIEQIK